MAARDTGSAGNLRARPVWLVLGWSLVALVIYLSLARVSLEVPVAQADKFEHLLAYGTLMIWFANLYGVLPARIVIAIGFVAMGIALEYVQRTTGYRTFDVSDMAANAAGVATGWLLAPPRLPSFLQAVEIFCQRISKH